MVPVGRAVTIFGSSQGAFSKWSHRRSRLEPTYNRMRREFDLQKSRQLPWTDFRTGMPIRLDWDNSGFADSMPVMRLDKYIEQYANHPESKGADPNGNPATEETRGLLGELDLYAASTSRIGKEIDRLDQDEGTTLDHDQPITYGQDDPGFALSVLDVVARMPRKEAAEALGISVRRFQDVVKGRSRPRAALRRAIIRLAKIQVSRVPGAATHP